MDSVLRKFSYDDITKMMATFRIKVQVKDRRSGLRVLRQCFIGQEAVTTISAEFGLNRYEALLLGRIFESRSLFHGAGKDREMPLRDGVFFYRFEGDLECEDPNDSKGGLGRNFRHAIGGLHRRSKADSHEYSPSHGTSSTSGSISAPASPSVPAESFAVWPEEGLLDTYFGLPILKQGLGLLAFCSVLQCLLLLLPFPVQVVAVAALCHWTLHLMHRNDALRRAGEQRTSELCLQTPPASPDIRPKAAAVSRGPVVSSAAKTSAEITLAYQSRDYLQIARLSEEVAGELAQALSARRGTLADQQFLELLRIEEGTPPSDCRLLRSIAECRLSFLLSDPTQPGHPIIYASNQFKEFTGFSDAEIRDLNKSQQLHGPETSMETLLAIQQAIIDQVPISVRLRLYKKDRTPFWCQFYVQPLFAADGTVAKWVAIHNVTEKEDAPELLLLPKTKLQPPEIPVSSPELERTVRRLREQLHREFPTLDLDYFDTDFLAAVASKPGRTFELCMERLRGTAEWRREVGVDALTEAEVLPMLMSTEMFWHRFDTYGRPILYLRPGKQDMRTFDRPLTFKAIVYTVEQGRKLMPPGVVTFILVIDAEGAGWAHFDTQLTKQVLSMATVGYRDRVDRIVVGPAGLIVSAAWRFIRPYCTEAQRNRIHITNTPAADLAEFVNPKDIPHHIFKA